MGIKNLFKLRVSTDPDTFIDDLAVTHEIAELSGKRVAIDALNVIYANMYAVRDHMKSDNGEITTHIVITLRQIMRYRKFKIKQIWVFDSTKPHTLKAETISSRKIKLSSSNIVDIKQLLSLCGIPYIQVPAGIEAENYAAMLTKPTANRNAFCYGVISNDSDVIMLGGRLLRKHGRASYKLYDGTIIRKHINISCGDWIKIGIILGSDFAPKTPRIGPKTVLAKYKTITLTDRQTEAFNYLTDRLKMSATDYHANKFNETGLREYLTTRNFGKKTITAAVKALK